MPTTTAQNQARMLVVLANFGSHPHKDHAYETHHSGWNPRSRPCSFCGDDIDTQNNRYQTARDEDDHLHHFHATRACTPGTEYEEIQRHLPTACARGVNRCHVCEQRVSTPFQVDIVHKRKKRIICSFRCVEIDHHATQDLSDDDS